MEIFPVTGIEEKLGALQPKTNVAVTCSPTKGVDETIELSEKIMAQDFLSIKILLTPILLDTIYFVSTRLK